MNKTARRKLKIIIEDSLLDRKGYFTAILQPWRFERYDYVYVSKHDINNGALDTITRPNKEYTYAIILENRKFVDALLARFRCRFPCYVSFITLDEVIYNIKKFAPKEGYKFSSVSDYSYSNPQLEFSKEGDMRFAGTVLRYKPDLSMEDYFKLDLLGMRIAGYNSWRECKNLFVFEHNFNSPKKRYINLDLTKINEQYVEQTLQLIKSKGSRGVNISGHLTDTSDNKINLLKKLGLGYNGNLFSLTERFEERLTEAYLEYFRSNWSQLYEISVLGVNGICDRYNFPKFSQARVVTNILNKIVSDDITL